ncbi:MAG: hypothetical protein WCR95_08195 [Eubacteriales bacterium]
MSGKFFSKQFEDIEKICVNCIFATPIEATENCVCRKKGMVRCDFTCGKFSADLLKINPRPVVSPKKEIIKEIVFD